MSERARRRQNLAEQMAEELGASALEDRLRIVERMADLDLPTDDESVDSFERLLSEELS